MWAVFAGPLKPDVLENDLPEPDDMGFAEPADPPGAYIDGRWVDVEDLPVGYPR